MWQTFLSERLQQAQEQDAVRRREANDGADGRTLLINGRRAVNFSGNDYLGLSRHPAVIRAGVTVPGNTAWAAADPVMSPVTPRHTGTGADAGGVARV